MQKHFYQNRALLIFFASLAYLMNPATLKATQLSGTYTIDPTQPATLTNFQNFTSAISYLTSTSARSDGGPANAAPLGVSGPVLFTVAAGTYAERVIISSAIPGASASSTITFDGGNGNAATRVITAAGTSAATEATVQLSAARYVSFLNLTVRCTGTRGRGFNLTSTAGMINIKRCIIDISGGIGSTSANFRGIMVETQADSVEIDSNEINYGYYGIFVSGSGSPANNSGIRLRANTIKNSYNNGISVAAVQNPVQVNYNQVNMLISANTNGQGITMDNCLQSTGISHQIIGNKVINGGKYAFRIINTAVSSFNPLKIYNNMVVYTPAATMTGSIVDRYGFEIGAGVAEFFHNSININANGSTSITRLYGLYFNGNDSSEFKNNVFACTGSLTSSILQPYPAYFNINPSGNRVNYNSYYNTLGTGTKTLLYRGGSSYNATNYRTVAAGGDSSFNLLPSWESSESLRFSGPCNLTKGTDLTALVPDDIDREMRSATPHIGCDEFPTLSTNISLTEVLQPKTPVQAGLQDLRVRVSNVGNNPVTTFNMTYELNGAPPVTEFVNLTSAPLNTCDTTSVLFTSFNQINILPGTNTLKIYLSSPNFTIDDNPLNDTFNLTLITSMSGTYTIGPSGADFPTFNAAAMALAAGGVNGPVNFKVMTGTYNEQVSFGPILGASPSGNIVFESMAAHPDSVTLSFNSGAANNYVVRFDKAAYFTFRNMTIRSLNTSNGRVVVMLDTASYDTIDNCKLTGILTSSSSDGLAVVYAFVHGNNNLTIRNCTISNGSYGLFVGEPNSSTQVRGTILIEGNTISAFSYQNYFRAISKMRFRNNRISSVVPGGSLRSLYLIYGANNSDSLEVTGNTAQQSDGDCFYIESPENIYGIVANNSIAITGPHSGTTNGIYATGIRNIRFYHNSVNIRNTTSATGGSAVNLSASTATIELKNNVFSNESGGYAMTLNNTASFTSDYNNLYNSSGNLVFISGTGTNHANLPFWKTSSSKDLNSVSYRAGFTGAADLKPNIADTASWSLNGRGIHIDANVHTRVRTDLDGNLRPQTQEEGLPDIGAFEFTPTALAPACIPVPAVVASIGDTQTFMFLGDTVAKICWQTLNGQSITVRQYVGNAPAGSGPEPHMFYYADIENPGFNFYTASLYYKNLWRGTMPNETDMVLAKKTSSLPYWNQDFGAQVDTVKNVFYSTPATEPYQSFSGSNIYQPLPVTLSAFAAHKQGRAAMIGWSTAAEKGIVSFEVQRSWDNKRWNSITTVSAAGESNEKRHYVYVDEQPLPLKSTAPVTYYRLRINDRSAPAAYSAVAAVTWENRLAPGTMLAYPLPFTDHINLLAENLDEADVDVVLTDITGREVSEPYTIFTEHGKVTINNLSGLRSGVYFITIDSGGNHYRQKLVRQ